MVTRLYRGKRKAKKGLDEKHEQQRAEDSDVGKEQVVKYKSIE